MKKLPILAAEIGFAFGFGLCNLILGLSKILPLPKIINLIGLILGLIFALISLLSILLNKENDDESSILNKKTAGNDAFRMILLLLPVCGCLTHIPALSDVLLSNALIYFMIAFSSIFYGITFLSLERKMK